MVECDALKMIQGLLLVFLPADSSLVYSNIQQLLRLVNSGSCHYIPRNGNKMAAYSLAQFAANNSNELYWIDLCPLFLSSYILDDLVVLE